MRTFGGTKPLAAAPRNLERCGLEAWRKSRRASQGDAAVRSHNLLGVPGQGLCVWAPGRRPGVCEGRQASETQAGESSRLTEKRRTLKLRLSTAVNLREMRMVSEE